MQVESRGFTIDYAVDGDGPPLVLVAGTLCAARHWVDYGYAAALARHWRVINIDPLGHGASDTPHDADSYEVAGVTADLVAVLDAEGVDSATVWGYSRGGWLACNLASRYPDRVDRIVVGAYAMHAHEEEVGRTADTAGRFLAGRKLGQALGEVRCHRSRVPEDDGTELIRLPWRRQSTVRNGPRDMSIPRRSVALQPITSAPKDWIVPYVRADVEALGATVDIIDGQGHLGSFFASAEPVLSAMSARLGH